MNFLKHSWVILLTFFTAMNTGFADTVLWTEAVSGKDTTRQLITVRVPAEHHIETRAVEIPLALVNKLAAQAIKVGHHHNQSLKLKRIQLHGDQVVVIGQRLVSQLAYNQMQPSFWLQEVRVTFPRHYLANSWDVLSLQRELERLGIKIKPKPASPKPTQQLSG